MPNHNCNSNSTLTDNDIDPSYLKTIDSHTGEVVYETTGQVSAFSHCFLKQLIDEHIIPEKIRQRRERVATAMMKLNDCENKINTI